MKFLAILTDTFREALAKKTIIAFFSIATLLLIIALFGFILGKQAILNPQSVQGVIIPPPREIIEGIQVIVARLVYGPAILFSIFATASIIPGTLEKGSIDLLLSKPVSRLEILFGKFSGGILIVLFNVTYYIFGMWLIMSFTFGYWNVAFLASIFSIMLAFIVLFAFVVFIGVTTRSSALAIIITFLLFMVIVPILTSREQIFTMLIHNETVQGIITFIYYILPKTDELANTSNLLISHKPIEWMPIWSSGLFGAAMFGGSVYFFRKKDF